MGIGASMALYAGGMVLNDLVDQERDRTLHPDRPLPSGALSRGLAWKVVTGLGMLGLMMAAGAGLRVLMVALMLAACISAYNLWLKKFELPGSLAMGVCRALNVLMGLSLGNLTGTPGWMPAVTIGFFVFGLTWFSTSEEQPGSRSGVGGIAVMWTVLVVVMGWWMAKMTHGWWGLPAAVIAWMMISLGLDALNKQLTKASTQSWVGRLVRNLIAWDAAWAGALVGWKAMAGVWVLMIPGYLLTRGTKSSS